MILTYLMLAVALSLSAVAAFYSIAGLVAIFAAATIPITIMGSILEIAKLTVTVWLHEYWSKAKWLMKVYLTTAVVILMMITSMGIFGFLSKAHSDQSLVSGDVTAKISVYDEKIKTEKENIDANRKALKQMDEAVDQVMGRSSDEKGADKAVAIRRAQQKERGRLLADIATAQQKISLLNEERAPIAAEIRKVEAEVGPIKYIAAVIYGDNPDTNLLEKSVRWVIILLVLVFDPLAVSMLVSATGSKKWEEELKKELEKEKELADSIDNEKLIALGAAAQQDAELVNTANSLIDNLDKPAYEKDNGPLTNKQIEKIKEVVKEDLPSGETIVKSELFPEVEELQKTSNNTMQFGTLFPADAIKGDCYLRIDELPTVLYKYNGRKWIMVDKQVSDSYAYNDEYINYLIEKIKSGEYDPELLSNAERARIEELLRRAL